MFLYGDERNFSIPEPLPPAVLGTVTMSKEVYGGMVMDFDLAKACGVPILPLFVGDNGRGVTTTFHPDRLVRNDTPLTQIAGELVTRRTCETGNRIDDVRQAMLVPRDKIIVNAWRRLRGREPQYRLTVLEVPEEQAIY